MGAADLDLGVGHPRTVLLLRIAHLRNSSGKARAKSARKMRAILLSSQRFDISNSQLAPLARPQPARFCASGDPMLFAQNFSEQHPALAVESRKLNLLDRVKVGRARVDPDPGQEH